MWFLQLGFPFLIVVLSCMSLCTKGFLWLKHQQKDIILYNACGKGTFTGLYTVVPVYICWALDLRLLRDVVEVQGPALSLCSAFSFVLFYSGMSVSWEVVPGSRLTCDHRLKIQALGSTLAFPSSCGPLSNSLFFFVYLWSAQLPAPSFSVLPKDFASLLLWAKNSPLSSLQHWLFASSQTEFVCFNNPWSEMKRINILPSSTSWEPIEIQLSWPKKPFILLLI